MNRVFSAIFSGCGASVAIAVLGIIGDIEPHLVVLMAPFGATAVLLFGLPDSPLSAPKNVIFGHTITALIGVFFVHFIGVTFITLAVATGLGVSVMLLTKTTHPPAGANPLLIMLTGQNWVFLFTPVLCGACAMAMIGFLYKQLRSRYVFNTSE